MCISYIGPRVLREKNTGIYIARKREQKAIKGRILSVSVDRTRATTLPALFER
jgi:hypothetical protein